jgi:hypothetical protein
MLQLASFQGGVDGRSGGAAEATPLPLEQMRPVGPITLAGRWPGPYLSYQLLQLLSSLFNS